MNAKLEVFVDVVEVVVFFVDSVVTSNGWGLVDVNTASHCQSQWQRAVLLPCMLV